MKMWFVGIIVIIIFTFLFTGFLFWGSGDKSISKGFDERQSKVRARAYKHAFGAMLAYHLGYFMVASVWQGAFERPLMEDGVSSFIGIMLAMVIFVSESIWNDAAVSFREKPLSWGGVILTGGVAVLCGWASVLSLLEGGMVENGVLTREIFSFVECIGLLVICVVILAKKLRSRREEAEEE